MSSAPLKPNELVIERSWDGAFRIKIETPRLTITSVIENDVDHYCNDLFGDPDVMESYSNSKPKGHEFVKSMIDNFINVYKDGKPFSAMTVRLKDDTPIGALFLLMIDSDPYKVSLSYLFAKDHWNQSYAKEAVNAAVNYFASSLNVMPFYDYNSNGCDQPKKIWAAISSNNPASTKILESICGLKEIEYSPPFVCYEGEVSPPDPSRKWEILISRESMIVKERY